MRNAFLPLSLALVVFSAATTAQSQSATGGAASAPDESAIRAAIYAQADAWNRADIPGFMQAYERSPETAAVAVRAIVKSQAALKEDPARATTVGRKLFPPSETELIAELIRRDLPFYDARISSEFVNGMNQFARDLGILKSEVPYEKVVAARFAPLWRA